MEKEISKDLLFTDGYADKVEQRDSSTEEMLLFNGSMKEQSYDKILQERLFITTAGDAGRKQLQENGHGDWSIMLFVMPIVVGVAVLLVLKKILRRVHSAEYDCGVL